MTMIGISVVALLMFMRIRALYPRSYAIHASVLSILLTFIGVNSWLLTHGIPVPHPAYPLVDSCTMIVDPKVPGPIASSTAWLPLLYDTVVISLTLIRTASSMVSKNPSQMFRVLLREGLLYYSVICAITLILTIMIIHAPPSIRNITAQLHLCVTVAMMSRITLHLKRFAQRPNGIVNDNASRVPFPRRFFSFGQITTLAAPTYATPAARAQPDVTFYSAQENDTFLGMETFSTSTVPGPFGESHVPGISVSA